MIMAVFALCDAIGFNALLLSPPFVVKENQPLPSSQRRNQEQIANFPRRQGVAHQEQIRRPVFADGVQGF
jgi:hypothetical protein